MIQLTQAEYDTLVTQAKMYRELMIKIQSIHLALGAARTLTGASRTALVGDALALIDKLPRIPFGGYDPSFNPRGNPENPQTEDGSI